MAFVELPPAYENRHIFTDPAANPNVRESLAWLLPLPAQGLGIIVYTWVHAVGYAGAAAIAYGPSLSKPVFKVVDKVPIAEDMAFADWQVGPMRLSMPEGMSDMHIQFDDIDITLDYDFKAINPSYAYGANPGGCPQWLAHDRTEQGGSFKGSARVGDRTIAVDTLGHRDHSWGTRDWGSALHWKWFNLLAEPDVAIHVMELQALGSHDLRGYVHKQGKTALVSSWAVDFDTDDRMMHTVVRGQILDELGRTTEFVTTQGADFEWPVSTRLTLHEASMFATVDGQDGVAYMEMVWPPDYLAHLRGIPLAELYGGRDALTLDKTS